MKGQQVGLRSLPGSARAIKVPDTDEEQDPASDAVAKSPQIATRTEQWEETGIHIEYLL